MCRLSNSDQHKQAIRDAIKAKWQDPEYREYMCQVSGDLMQDAVASTLRRANDAYAT